MRAYRTAASGMSPFMGSTNLAGPSIMDQVSGMFGVTPSDLPALLDTFVLTDDDELSQLPSVSRKSLLGQMLKLAPALFTSSKAATSPAMGPLLWAAMRAAKTRRALRKDPALAEVSAESLTLLSITHPRPTVLGADETTAAMAQALWDDVTKLPDTIQELLMGMSL